MSTLDLPQLIGKINLADLHTFINNKEIDWILKLNISPKFGVFHALLLMYVWIQTVSNE